MSIREKFDWSVRAMRSSDLGALMKIKNAENWNQTEKDWLFLIKSNPEYCFVAVLGNKVIGTITAINYQQKVAWIGMMLVAKEYRGLGVSKMLLNTVIKKLDGCDSIKLDATPTGVLVYKKLGFKAEYEVDRMVSSGLPEEIINQADSGVYELSNILSDDINKIVALDKMIFGVERSELIHYLLNNKRDVCFKFIQGNHLKGFVLGRDGSNYLQIGPLLADTPQTAKLLLKRIFYNLKQRPLVIDVLTDQQELKSWLLHKNFKYERSFTRMYLKTNDYSGKKENQFLISGPELG